MIININKNLHKNKGRVKFVSNQDKQFYKECFKELIKQKRMSDALMISSEAGYGFLEKDQSIIIELTKRKHLLSSNYSYSRKNSKIKIVVDKDHPTLNKKLLKIMHHRHEYTKLNDQHKYKVRVLEFEKNENEKIVIYLADIYNVKPSTSDIEVYSHRLKEIVDYKNDYELLTLLNQDFQFRIMYIKDVIFDSNDDFYNFAMKEYRVVKNTLSDYQSSNKQMTSLKSQYLQQIQYYKDEIDRYQNKIYKIDLPYIKLACQKLQEFDSDFKYKIKKTYDEGLIFIDILYNKEIDQKLMNDTEYATAFYKIVYDYIDVYNITNYAMYLSNKI